MPNEINRITLNGDWTIDYLSKAPYASESEPEFEGYFTKGAVPGYWEDMTDAFSQMRFFIRFFHRIAAGDKHGA